MLSWERANLTLKSSPPRSANKTPRVEIWKLVKTSSPPPTGYYDRQGDEENHAATLVKMYASRVPAAERPGLIFRPCEEALRPGYASYGSDSTEVAG